MEESKSLETMYGMIWIDSDHSLHPNQSLMKCDVWQPCSDQRWLASIFNLKIFWVNAFTNNHLLCYWPTIYNLISKIWPKFQSLSSHFFKVDELLHKHWAKIVQSENVQVSTPIYIECNKMYWPNVCIQGFWYIMSGLQVDIKPGQSKNNNSACKKAVLCCKIIIIILQRYNNSYTIFSWTYGSVVTVSSSESD